MRDRDLDGHCPVWLNRCIEFSIYGLVFFLALSEAAATFCLVIGALAWGVKLCLTRGRAFHRTPFDKPILAFAAFAGVSVLASPDGAFSFYNYHQLVGRYLLTYYLVVENMATMRQMKRVLVLGALSALAVAGYGFYQYIHGIDVTDMLWVDGDQFPELKTRVFSTLENPNLLAGYLIVMMSLVFGLLCRVRRSAVWLLLAGFFAVLAVCLGMTYCRGAWLSLFFVLAGYGVARDRRIVLSILAAVAIVLVMDTGVTERLLSSFSASDTSSSMRVALWESTVAMIVEHPLFGIGWGAYWMAYPAYDFFIQNEAVKIVHAHSMYLNFAAEIGPFGALAFFLSFFGHLGLALESANLRESPWLNGLLLGAGLALAAVAVNGLTDYVLFNIQLSMQYWLVCALVVLASRRSLR